MARSQRWEVWEQDKTPQAVVFLNLIQKAIVQERALLGLDAPRSVLASLVIGELPTDTVDNVIGGP